MQKKLGADLCVGTDPDCDRVGVACLTASGEVRLLTGNQIGCVLLHLSLIHISFAAGGRRPARP